ncbi:predicted protein [Uncinocarpus reesii 1704]|uniref:Clathrin/coatomer adaptor adaptin-like N-terminal domain-containing protein n=1 Tax=Uncinocarpus reesii (strain UAMH 1704) TaxID=336963 RepID=C4K063_UNCRE|nr:uncharacterized protein UREG_07814 [Uncinocarpus reesii 1704]EEP82949.1 predicted protein [Uncinocarpus reesii 1704]
MFGYDMSWAAFHVLEVMSSQNYLQKRVGYLGAVQSFRPDTEVLMLTTNLLKKVVKTSTKYSSGYRFSARADNVVTPLSPSSYHFPVASPVAAFGFAAPPLPFPSIGAEEDRSKPLPAIPGVSRSVSIGVAEDKRAPNGRAGRQQCHRRGDKRGVIKLQTKATYPEAKFLVCFVDAVGTAPYSQTIAAFDDHYTNNVRHVPSLRVYQRRYSRRDPRRLRGGSHCASALQLVSTMVTSDTLQPVVDRLITQLRTSPLSDVSVTNLPLEVKLSADIEVEDPEVPLAGANRKQDATLVLPTDYRMEVLARILEACSRNTYSSIIDFEWYVDVLVQLVKLIPPLPDPRECDFLASKGQVEDNRAFAARIGLELRNVAVRVKSARAKATHAAESLVSVDHRAALFPNTINSAIPILESSSWVTGEFSEYLLVPEQTLSSLVHPSNITLPPKVLSSYLQAIPKVFVFLTRSAYGWSSVRQNEILIIIARIVSFLESLSSHHDLDVQERAIEFLELFRIVSESVSKTETDTENAPLLLYSVIPSLFAGLDLNPVAADAQRKVPTPRFLDLDSPLNKQLPHILNEFENGSLDLWAHDDFHDFYNAPQPSLSGKPSPQETLPSNKPQSGSYQNLSDDFLSPIEASRRRAERRERNKDDPFYIQQSVDSFEPSRSSHSALRETPSEILDVDSIPIVDLAVEKDNIQILDARQAEKPRHRRKNFDIIADETIDVNEASLNAKASLVSRVVKTRKPLLEVDSSGLDHLTLEEKFETNSHPNKLQHGDLETNEMAEAMARIEQARLEMQRVSECIHASDEIPSDGALVKRKKRKLGSAEGKKRRKPAAQKAAELTCNASECTNNDEATVGKKKKKKRVGKKETSYQAQAVIVAHMTTQLMSLRFKLRTY